MMVESGVRLPTIPLTKNTVNMHNKQLVEPIATKFLEFLRRDVGDDNFKKLCADTKRDRPWEEGVCYSHDYLDANMTMDEAMTFYGLPYGLTPDDEDAESDESQKYRNDWMDTANAAWSIAQSKMVEIAS